MTSLKRCIIRATSIAMAVIFSAGCDSSTEPESPPIPSFAEASCKTWSCSTYYCGRDTGRYGPCCIEYGTPAAQSKPSCTYVPPCKPGVNC
jgi:hypothetical protein